VVALLVLALLRGKVDGEPVAAYDMRVYRDQLKEVERDLARGVIAEADADRVRTEVSRRILATDATLQRDSDDTGQSRTVSIIVSMLLLAGLVGGSLLIYQRLGAPGYGDLSQASRINMAEDARRDRPLQAQAEASLPPLPAPEVSARYLELIEQLRATVAKRPDDLQGHTLLAQNEAALGNFVAAYQAQANVLRIRGQAAEAGEYSDYADMMILAAGGYVSPEAEAALARALELDPRNGPARYYWGLMRSQTGRPDLTFRIWDRLLRESRNDAPWVPPIREQIEGIAERAGVDYTLPPVAPPAPPMRGPDAEDVEAASTMTPEERMAMIRSMVDGLSERLATEGGSPREWARLISALAVLDETDRARAIYDEAEQVFADDDDALDLLRDAAGSAGLLQ